MHEGQGNKVKSDLEFLGQVWQCLDSLDFEELGSGLVGKRPEQ